MCPSCGRPTYQPNCQTCGRVAFAAVYPHARTYGVTAVGIAASVAIVLATLTGVAAQVMPVVVVRTVDAASVYDLAVLIGLLLVVAMAFLLLAGGLVAAWLYRARRNLDAFPGAIARVRAGWAIGAWFVPIICLVYPCRMMLDLVRESRRGDSRLVGVWWAAWLCFGLGERVVAYLEERMIWAFDTGLVRALVLAPALMVAGAALVALITRVSRAQEDRIAIGPPAVPLVASTVPIPPPYLPGATIGR